MSEISESNTNNTNKILKSELFHIWKKARLMYDMIKDGTELEGWVKKSIDDAYDNIDKALQYMEYSNMFPEKKDESLPDEKSKNNYLSNEDKRYPTPTAQENGDQFMTRCILDANMKKDILCREIDLQPACLFIITKKIVLQIILEKNLKTQWK